MKRREERKIGNQMAKGSSSNGNNLKNGVIALLVLLPSILFYLCFLSNCGGGCSSGLWKWCYHHPLLLVNALFFLNVNLLFWLISHVQSSHWVRQRLLLCRIPKILLNFSTSTVYLINWCIADDRPVLDSDTCDAGSLFCFSPFS